MNYLRKRGLELLSDPLRAMAEKMAGDWSDPAAAEAAMAETQQRLRPVAEDDFRPPVDEASKALALAIAEAADDRKAGNITILQTGDISYLADYFVIATGFSAVQVRAIANSIEAAIKEQFDRLPLRTEGLSEGRWVLQDYGEVIVHIFMPDDREYYDLEAFWGHAERIPFTPAASPAMPSSLR
jgi:ribosome-associated protein